MLLFGLIGHCTDLRQSHFVVWDCKVLLGASGLELVHCIWSARSLASKLASVAVLGSARSPCTSSLASAWWCTGLVWSAWSSTSWWGWAVTGLGQGSARFWSAAGWASTGQWTWGVGAVFSGGPSSPPVHLCFSAWSASGCVPWQKQIVVSKGS